MGSLYRPHIPLSVRVIVAARQLRAHGDKFSRSVLYGLSLSEPKNFPGDPTLSFARKLACLLSALAICLGCDVKDLRLDHDPALGARPQRRRGLGRKTYYIPDANDPDHLFYRPHGPEHAGSHLIKTNVRGDHGQHPDRVLIKKERKRSRKRETPAKASRFPKASARSKRIPGFEPAFAAGRIEDAHDRVYYRATKRVGGTKRQWPKRSFEKRSKPR